MHFIFLQTPSSSNLSFWITMLGIMVIFYFFMVRPQQRKQKEQRKFIEEVAKGDDVVTIGGLHGKVQSVEEETITILVDKGIKLVFDKSSISVDSSRRLKAKQ